jgi:hypothetical protein
VDKYKRFYPKLQTVLANIGGVMKFIMFIGQMITQIITTKIMYIDLSNSFVDHDIKENEYTNLNFMLNVNSPIRIQRKHSGKKLFDAQKFKQPVIHHSKSKFLSKLHNNISVYNINDIKVNNVNNENNEKFLTKKRMTLIESIISNTCCYKNKTKNIVKDCERIIKSNVSSENLLNITWEIEKLKQIVFDEKENKIFQNVPKLSILEHIKRMKSSTENKINVVDFENYFNSDNSGFEINNDDERDKIRRRLQKMFN